MSKKVFINRGNQFDISDSASISVHATLPVGTYKLCVAPQRGLYLETTNELTVPSKIYGGLDVFADRVLTTYKARGRNTGVALVGAKGSGKSMTLCSISAKAAAEGMPTIIINQGFTGDSFYNFLNSIEQPCVLAFDEFEKMYDRSEQNELLTFLDGLQTSSKLFAFTANDMEHLTVFMRGRPGRVFYLREFVRMEYAVMKHYCQEELRNFDTQFIGVEHIANVVPTFNFDMLKALVEEMNRYGEDARTAATYLNIRPEGNGGVYRKITGTENGNDVTVSFDDSDKTDPRLQDIKVIIHRPIDEPNQRIMVTKDHLTEYNSETSRGAYTVGDFEFVIESVFPKAFSF